jgi:trk system potassium uptake protein
MIGFIFVSTIIIETIGAFIMHGMWGSVDSTLPNISAHPVFASVFHSISAFCNAGFALSNDSLIRYQSQWQVYGVFCVLIVLGGLGFGVLYDMFKIIYDRVKRVVQAKAQPQFKMQLGLAKSLTLQSRIVLCSSAVLIIGGAVLLILLEYFNGGGFDIKSGIFQSITARTAGFNTVDIDSISSVGKMVLIILMFIGGSPGSTAGGIKTVTLVVIIMAVWSTIRKRSEVEVFKRSVKFSIVGRAMTVALVFVAALFICVTALSITERNNDIRMGDIMFESTSALGTVGLSTGITGSLTSAGKLIIILTMLIGRLGPLTLLASLTFNLKPGRFNYPSEALIVG